MTWVAALLQASRRVGPRVAKTIGVALPLLADEKNRKWLSELLTGLPRNVNARPVTRRQKLAARVGKADEMAVEMLESATTPEEKERATRWRQRASDLRKALELGSLQGRQERQRVESTVAGALDELLADMIAVKLHPPTAPRGELS
jgi:hypothetical protein